jgi:hypothetical protein
VTSVLEEFRESAYARLTDLIQPRSNQHRTKADAPKNQVRSDQQAPDKQDHGESKILE